jgi:DNA-binding Lrp family transcriptional regulator
LDATGFRVFGHFIAGEKRIFRREREALSIRDKAYTDLMKELWGSPDIWNTKKSYIEIAERLGVDEETVRNRIKRLREIGFLLGYRVVPNPALLATKSASIRVDFGDRESKEAAIPRLAKMDNIINIASSYDKGLLITLFADEKRGSPILEFDLGVGGKVSTVSGLELKTTNFRMTPLDWDIVSALLRDAERPLDEIAKQLRVSTRTVKRRLNMMREEAAIFTMPMVDLTKTEGVPYQLRVQIEPGKKSHVEKLVAKRIGTIVFRASDMENSSIFGFTGANVAEGNEVFEWLGKQPGVV